MHNQLGSEASPYLRQHADNPVHWWPWGRAALDEAARRDCPILLSIGYAACHWCHVMAHESFEDARVAGLMNAGFVNIKVDREERPDIDHLYMTALQAMGQRGGWPLTMFLRPDGTPFWGGTYFPPEPRHGQPSFADILRAIRMAWDDRAALIDDNAGRLRELLTQAAEPGNASWPEAGRRAEAARRLVAATDPVRGGLAGAPKFPNAPVFRFLWQTGTDAGAVAVERLLEAMVDGGIHDQIGGGFARYATDADWLVPHFEKMLYDNAQILELLAFVHAHRPALAGRAAAERLVGWLTREMQVGTAFAASLDADSEGEEGRFYVWQADEIAAALAPLGADRVAHWRQAYGVTAGGNWEGHTILSRVGPIDVQTDAEARALLLARRERRPRPARDDKVLADWNALAVIALVRAAGVFGRPDWDGLARSVWQGVETMLAGSDGRLAHAACDGRITASGLLEDQAAGALAALALYEADGTVQWLERALGFVDAAERWFTAPGGGYVQVAADATDLPLRPRPIHDSALPTGLAMLAEAQARLFHLTGEDRFRLLATHTIETMAEADPVRLTLQPGMLFAADLLERGRTLVIDGAAQADWITLARSCGVPNLLILRGDTVTTDTHPAHGRRAAPGETTAWLCSAGRCSLPIRDADALLAAIREG
ncbi:hypothetical protein FHR90_000079 [Endobacter medicaginis]|uniref:Spermatogenesis-associated protein 20-like TRX domain-containing protein n=3 Tax=Endobacter medicaginis TaxID=1181271 RepID=A0A839UV47_9PROT|nr:thioredoxin domain-containing protein [Endobacter medicaginis]MBB3172273.1 hypothetical protein [Endobacter medicaginis]MCX5474607.1 thioredoxin domain-containing protein [Endobacter medicaginis]